MDNFLKDNILYMKATKNKVIYISILVLSSIVFFCLGWFLSQSIPAFGLMAGSKVETAKLNKDLPDFKIYTNTYSTSTNFVFSDEKGKVATTLSVSNENIESPSYRIIKGHTHDWLVITKIESSGTGFMNRIDDWYTILQDGTIKMVLSYPSNGSRVSGGDGQNEYWETNILNDSYNDDLAVDIKLTDKICNKNDKECSESSQTTHYIWNEEHKKFLCIPEDVNETTIYEEGDARGD